MDGPPETTNNPSPAVDLRRKRSDVSRQAIRDAVTRLLADEHPSTLSVPAVAAEAGVSVRTVYRYFPTKQDLLDDVAQIQIRRADAMFEDREALYNNPRRYLETLWTDFENDVEAIKAQHRSDLGADIRLTRSKTVRAGLDVRLNEAFPDAPDQDRQDLGDLIMTVMSSAAFLDLHTRLGRSGSDAARMAWWAVLAMQKQFEADGGMGRSSKTAAEDGFGSEGRR